MEQLDLSYIAAGRVTRSIYFGKLTVSTKAEYMHTV